MADSISNTTVTLQIIKNLLDSLHQKDILYCHWKSNQQLSASMVGATDLDVLFDMKEKEKIESLFNSLNFKRFTAIKQKRYKDIVDFIGLDLETGILIHLHTHYRLTLGESYLKGYQLDIESRILESRIFNEDFGIYCINPSYEYILLFT